MQWFYHLKIGTKLLASFITLALIAGIIGAIGVVNIRKADRNGNMMYNEVTVPIAKLGSVSTSFQLVRVKLARMMLARSIEEKQKLSDEIKELSAGITKNCQDVEGVLLDAEERTLMKDFSDSRTVFRPLIGKIAELTMAGRNEEALALYNGEATRAARVEQAAIDKLVDYEVAFAKKSAERNSEIAAAAQRSTVTLAVAGVLLALGFGMFITRLITVPLHEAVRVARQVADGDLTSDIAAQYTDETGQLLQALKEMNRSLVTIVGEVRRGSDSIATAAEQISAGNSDLSQRTEEQASALEETASSMEELTSTVKQNADNAEQANQLSICASEVARKGGDVIGRVVSTMGSISESSRRISDIIGVIDGIAFQTNILALNAAVEAARAGEQGRGFAVVAAEVRTLAQRSAAAAKEIKGLIEDSVATVQDGSVLVEEAGHTTEEILTSIRRVADIMAEISAASREQSAGIEQVNTAIAQMDEVTQQNAALVEQSAAAAESLEDQAKQLVQAASRFKLQQGDAPGPGQGAPVQAEPKRKTVKQPMVAATRLRPQQIAAAGALKATLNQDWQEF